MQIHRKGFHEEMCFVKKAKYGTIYLWEYIFIGKAVVISGAGRGICWTIVVLITRQGVSVLVYDHVITSDGICSSIFSQSRSLNNLENNGISL